MTATPDELRARRVAELRRRRAEDTAALIDAQLPLPPAALADLEAPLPAADLVACSARELAWLQEPGGIALAHKQTIRSLMVPHATTGVVTPFEPSALMVMYTARYFVAARRPPAPASPRDLYVVYGAIQAEFLPVALPAVPDE